MNISAVPRYGKSAPLAGNSLNAVSFQGHKIFLMDKGGHSFFLQKLAGLISDDMEIEEKETDYIDYSPVKKLSCLKKRPEEANALEDSKKPEYIAVPALVKIRYSELNNLIRQNYSIKEDITPENIQKYKSIILDFFAKVKENPALCSQCEDLNIGQEIEYLYDVIQEINKAVSNGIKVYIASHNRDGLLADLCAQRGIKPDLYYYLSSGIDAEGNILKLLKEISDNPGIQKFNLLNLSNAHNTGILGADGSVHPYSAQDSCINTYARGVYNCTPLRENSEITGFSISDILKHDFDSGVFHSYAEKFAGLKINDTLASDEECRELMSFNDETLIPEPLKEKLFPIDNIKVKGNNPGFFDFECYKNQHCGRPSEDSWKDTNHLSRNVFCPHITNIAAFEIRTVGKVLSYLEREIIEKGAERADIFTEKYLKSLSKFYERTASLYDEEIPDYEKAAGYEKTLSRLFKEPSPEIIEIEKQMMRLRELTTEYYFRNDPNLPHDDLLYQDENLYKQNLIKRFSSIEMLLDDLGKSSEKDLVLYAGASRIYLDNMKQCWLKK